MMTVKIDNRPWEASCMGATYESPCSSLHEGLCEADFEGGSPSPWSPWAWGGKGMGLFLNHISLDHDLFLLTPFHLLIF